MKVVVVGGGISGLATAHALAGIGPPDSVEIEVREADDRLGGKLKTTPFAGLPGVDEGADAFLARVPEATGLARAVGLGDVLTSPAAARAAVASRGRLHPIPDALVLGVPAAVTGLATSGLLSWRGKARAAVEPLIPARDPGDSIGALVRHRFGDEVHERLVDALVGTIYGADTDRFSLAMVPQLADLAGRGRSLLLSARRMRTAAPASTGPLFLAPRAGMGALTDAVADAAMGRGVKVLVSAPAAELARDGRRWRIDGDPADAVVLATPAAPTAPLLATGAPEAARLLATMDHAGVVLVTLAVERLPERLHGYSGYLVPKPEQAAVTAVSFASQKWAHWRPDDGRGGAARLAGTRRAAGRRPRRHRGRRRRRRRPRAGISISTSNRPTSASAAGPPRSRSTARITGSGWTGSMRSLPAGLFVTGASYRGIGIPACVAQAEATARAVAAYLAT